MSSDIPTLAAFLGDPHYSIPDNNQNSLTIWQLHNLTNLKSLTQNNDFLSFTELQTEYNLAHTEQMNYAKIRQFYQKYYSLTLHTPFSQFKQICLSSPHDRGLISRIYKSLNEFNMPDKSQHMRQVEFDLNKSFSPEQWDAMIVNFTKMHQNNFH